MAKKPDPVITHTEILCLAGAHIRDEIIRLKNETAAIERQANLVGKVAEVIGYLQANEQRTKVLTGQLLAVESMYLLETGTELGLSNEIQADMQAAE